MPPPIPRGARTVSGFGTRIMHWGRGDAAARVRMVSLRREDLEQAGVSRDIAEAWRDFYRAEAIRNPRNPSARGRADLMQRAAELFSGDE